MSYNHSAMSQPDEFLSSDTSKGSISVESGIKIPNQEPAHWFNGSFLSLSVFNAPCLGVQEITNFPELGLWWRKLRVDFIAEYLYQEGKAYFI